VTLDPNTRVVRVTQQNAGAARGLFEVHYYFKLCNGIGSGAGIHSPNVRSDLSRNLECPLYEPQFATGPFVSLNTNPFDTSGNYGGCGWSRGNAPDRIAHRRPPTSSMCNNKSAGSS
jgi:hypothetical protein